MLEPLRGQQAAKINELSKPIKQRKRSGTEFPKSVNDRKFLEMFLRSHHDPSLNRKNAHLPLTANEIAIAMNWISKSGNPLQSKVSRLMMKIFPQDGMRGYVKRYAGKDKSGKRIPSSVGLDDFSVDQELDDEAEDEF